VITELKARLDVPIIAGGFIHKRDVIAAIQRARWRFPRPVPNWSM
jgi:glycerol-3-phosphate responsive antiterminator